MTSTDVEQSKHTGDLLKVVFRDPGIPVRRQRYLGRTVILILGESPLVNDPIVAGIVEQGGSDPRLQHKPLRARERTQYASGCDSLRLC